MRESTNESSRNKATITFNHSLGIVVADFLVNKPLTLEQLDRLSFCLLTEALIALKSRTNMHYVSFTKVAIHETKRAAAKCQNPNSSYRIMPERYPSRRVHLQHLRKICRLSPRSKHTSTAPLRAQCVECCCLTADRGPPKRSLLYSLHDIYTSQITHNNFFYKEKKNQKNKTGFTFPHSMLWPIYTETTLKPLRASAL